MLACDDNIDPDVCRPSLLHCVLGYEVPASHTPVPPLTAPEIMPTIAPNLPAPKIMPTIAPNSTMTEGELFQELLAELEVNVDGMVAVGPVIDPEANVEAVSVTKQTSKRISFVNKCIRAEK